MIETSPDPSRQDNSATQDTTLANILFPLSNPKTRRELEDFRIRFESRFGPTDITRYYTSMRPLAEQKWLIDNHTQRYFDGLPPFAKAFLKMKMDARAADGSLDDAPDTYLQLYLAGGMRLNSGDRGLE